MEEKFPGIVFLLEQGQEMTDEKIAEDYARYVPMLSKGGKAGSSLFIKLGIAAAAVMLLAGRLSTQSVIFAAVTALICAIAAAAAPAVYSRKSAALLDVSPRAVKTQLKSGFRDSAETGSSISTSHFVLKTDGGESLSMFCNLSSVYDRDFNKLCDYTPQGGDILTLVYSEEKPLYAYIEPRVLPEEE